MTIKQAYDRYVTLKNQLNYHRERTSKAANGVQFYSDIYCNLNAKVHHAWLNYIETSRLGY